MGRRIDERFQKKWAAAISSTVGTDEGRLDRWIAVFDLMDAVRKVRPARSFALDGRYSLQDKAAFFSAFLSQSLGPRVPEEVEIFLRPLLERDLWSAIAFLWKEVLARFDEEAGRVVVEIHSSAPLSSEQQTKILERLLHFVNESPERDLGRKSASGRRLSVKPFWLVQPELIAGLEIRIGSRVWDASLSARIRELGRQLLKTA